MVPWMVAQGYTIEEINNFVDMEKLDNRWDPVRIVNNYKDIHVPAMHIGGWYDIFTQNTIDAFIGYQTQGGEGAASVASGIGAKPQEDDDNVIDDGNQDNEQNGDIENFYLDIDDINGTDETILDNIEDIITEVPENTTIINKTTEQIDQYGINISKTNTNRTNMTNSSNETCTEINSISITIKIG